MAKYYGTSLSAAEAPPKSTTFNVDAIVTVCFITRASVDSHDGFLAEIYEAMGPTTIEPTTNEYWTDEYAYTTDYGGYYYTN